MALLRGEATQNWTARLQRVLDTRFHRHSIIDTPGVSPHVFPWEKHPLPPVLYKYLHPERLDVLTKCLIRFSQIQVYEDEQELSPEVARFGTDEEIAEYLKNQQQIPAALRKPVADYIIGQGEKFVEFTKQFVTVPDEFGILCFTDNCSSKQMWEQYADNGRGFIVAFDTTCRQFKTLKEPGRIGKVEYSDEPLSSFLSAYGPNTFFRKRTRYHFESEWRSIRALSRFSDVIKPKDALPIYLSHLDPECVREVLILPTCSVEWELRTLVAVDARYRHVPVNTGKTRD